MAPLSLRPLLRTQTTGVDPGMSFGGGLATVEGVVTILFNTTSLRGLLFIIASMTSLNCRLPQKSGSFGGGGGGSVIDSAQNRLYVFFIFYLF